jgi:hypothetical protein
MTISRTSCVAVLAAAFGLTTSSDAFADPQVVSTIFPAHTEWCSKSKFDAALFQSPVGHDSVMTQGAAPILDAAFKAGAQKIGQIYIRTFQPTDNQVEATFCAGVPPSLQTTDAAIAAQQVPAVQILAAVCADPDGCMADLTAVLKDRPYNLTQAQIDSLDWHYAPILKLDSSADAIAAGLAETESTPISKEAATSQIPDEHVYTIVAVPRPTQ